MISTPDATRAPRRRSRLTMILLTAVAAGAMLAPMLSPTAPTASAATPLPDGLTSRTAAGSCWEVKQNYPSSADGSYWILTPALKAPQQFHCDMTTDGGGWVLVARGREGWKNQYNGLRPSTVRTTVDGPGAFITANLPAKTVDGLLNNGKVSALDDGIRLRRAMNQDGSQRQEVRFTMPKRDRWVWTFRAEHPVGTYKFNSVAGSGGITNNFGGDNAYRRIDTNIPASQKYSSGFAYGSQVAGFTSSTSYLWSNTNGAGGARPFTQMYLRPKLTLAAMTFGSIPDSGSAAERLKPLPESDAIRTVWGVTGNANGIDGELNTEVAAFAQVGNTVFVGGNFRYVQRTLSSTGADKIEQPYLAAFDVNTGQYVATFRPNLNGQVKSIAGLPDGRLAVGGQFTTANGIPSPSIVVLDATSGSTTGWQIGVENRTTGGIAQVRGMSLHDNSLYLAGSFTHVTRAGQATASGWNGARVNVATGSPDTNWDPRFNGASVGVDAADAGDRTYFSGYFRQSGELPTLSASAIQTAAGAQVAQPIWQPKFSKSGVDAGGNVTGNIWQLGIAETKGIVYLGGSEHSLFGYDRNSFDRVSGSITKNGGDFQAVSAAGDLVFAGCHCGDFNYSNAFFWSGVGTNWTQADAISLMGAWDATTGEFQAEYSPITQARRGFGSWAIFTDSRGNLWTGGDYAYSVRANEVNQWSGGFVRFAPRDTVAPTRPGSFIAAAASGSTTTLSWSASTDDRTAVQYELIRDNKVVETTTARQLAVSIEETPVRYFVRSVDLAGNRSASSPVLVVQAGPPPTPPAAPTVTGAAIDAASVRLDWNSVTNATEYRVSRNGGRVGVVAAPTTTFTDTGLTAETTYNYSVIAVNGAGQQSTPGTTSVTTSSATSTTVELVASLSSWKWRFDSAPWPANWRESTFDDSTWNSGAAVLGWNTPGMGTDITIGSQTTRPLSAQFRQTFTVDDPATIATAQISVLANDGVVVYVNGTEVGRANLPTGTLTQTSYATAAPRSATAAAARVIMNVPVALLVAGNNVVAASSHSNYRSTPDMSFDVSLVGTK